MKEFRTHAIVLAIFSSVGVLTAGERLVRFNRDIRPILTDKCFACHGPDTETTAADLRLDVRDIAVDHGVIVPGNASASELVRRIFSTDDDQIMPPPSTHKPLELADREMLRRWIDEGAEYETHWSYTPLPRSDSNFCCNQDGPETIDRLIEQRLDEEGVAAVPPADRPTLIRRLSLDLTGIPPTADEVDQFVNNTSPDAYERLVDRLLDSDRYGERMAIYWLDLVRYADTVGYHGDQEVSQSPYRDYVIRAFNDNLPYDRFVREQLAGDLLPQATIEQRVASGYNRLNQTTEEGGSQAKEYLAIYFADRVRNVSQVFMGATLGCAQCHDHKYDPYTTRDFYSLGAFFADLDEVGVYSARGRPPTIRVPTQADSVRLAEIEPQLAELRTMSIRGFFQSQPIVMSGIAEQIASLEDERQTILDRSPTTVVSRAVNPRTIRVLPRGNWMDDSGEVVSPAIPSFLGELSSAGDRPTRLDLANWLCASNNSLTPRTMVNRLWMLLFGRGICTSVDDLGAQGTYPSNPELLDWLALRFVESGWDIKDTIRTIVLSRAYRRSSKPTAELRTRDPHNDLFARQGRFQIPAEMVRDSALAVSGLLVEQIGGPSVKPYQPAGYYAQLNFPKREYRADEGNNQYRRGVYTHWQRTFLHPMMKAFDAPSREECTARRARSNTPLQALTLLNDPTFVEAARVFAARILREGGSSADERLRWAYREAVSCRPTPSIMAELRRVLDRHSIHFQNHRTDARSLTEVGGAPPADEIGAVQLAAWTSAARVILNLHEFVTRY